MMMRTYNGIREQKITIKCCTRADISVSLAILYIFRDYELALLVPCQSYTLVSPGSVYSVFEVHVPPTVTPYEHERLKARLRDFLYGGSNSPLLVYKVALQLDLRQLGWSLNISFK